MNLPDLVLEIESVADMDLERAAAVGRAYDADPELRPIRVGGDPARIKVDATLEDLVRDTGLPIRWLTVRTNTHTDFEGGEIVLRPGRGGYVARDLPDGSRTFRLVPHRVNHDVLRSWADGETGRLDRVADLFVRLCEAIDACYGVASLLPRSRSLPPVDVGLAEVGWLNFFGPAFMERFPRLRDVAGAAVSANGGVSIRVADEPWDLDDAHRQPVIEALGENAFVRSWGPGTAEGVRVPSIEDHMRHSPGTMEMPWIKGEAEREAAQVERSRQRRHAAARTRRLKAMEGRQELAALGPGGRVVDLPRRRRLAVVCAAAIPRARRRAGRADWEGAGRRDRVGSLERGGVAGSQLAGSSRRGALVHR